MPSLYGFFRLLKTIAIFILIIGIAIPLRYGSTNHQHLRIRLLHSLLSVKHSLVPDPARPTLSADYRAFEDILRMKLFLSNDQVQDPFTIIKNIRSSFLFSTIIPKPPQCRINKELFDHDGHTVDTYWIDNHHKQFQRHADQIILYFHGGGYMLGNIESYSGIECHLSQLFNISILHVEYRLSPEHPLPAAVEDTVAIYRALLRQNISPSQLMFMGDSAGGGLALLTIQALITHELPVPRGVVVFSPWGDISSSSESHIRNRHLELILTTDNLNWVLPQLLGPNHRQLSANSPTFSPLFGSFEGFPPMYVTLGTAEILEDDSREVVKKAQNAGVDVTLEEGIHLMHIYPVFFTYFPEARNTLDNINKWIQTIFTNKHSQ